jgi:hypothetical protein
MSRYTPNNSCLALSGFVCCLSALSSPHPIHGPRTTRPHSERSCLLMWLLSGLHIVEIVCVLLHPMPEKRAFYVMGSMRHKWWNYFSSRWWQILIRFTIYGSRHRLNVCRSLAHKSGAERRKKFLIVFYSVLAFNTSNGSEELNSGAAADDSRSRMTLSNHQATHTHLAAEVDFPSCASKIQFHESFSLLHSIRLFYSFSFPYSEILIWLSAFLSCSKASLASTISR